MRILVAPDSFKGALSAQTAADAICAGIQRAIIGSRPIAQPMADGGEGTLDAVLNRTGKRHSANVVGADGKPKTVDYGVIKRSNDSRAVLLEVAQIVGWNDHASKLTPVLERQSTGLGQIVKQCMDSGHRSFLIGLGGSSTNDCGVGVLHALGVQFLDGASKALAPTINALTALSRIDATKIDPRVWECTFEILSDVNNPLTGDFGTTAIYGPQKGIKKNEIKHIDRSIKSIATHLEQAFKRQTVQDDPGSGAAGGIGFALKLLGGKYRQGAAVIAELIDLALAIEDADWVITGEGKTDTQTLHGKAPVIVAQLALERNVPVTILSGSVDSNSRNGLAELFSAGCFSLAPGPLTLDESIARTAELLESTAFELAQLRRTARE